MYPLGFPMLFILALRHLWHDTAPKGFSAVMLAPLFSTSYPKQKTRRVYSYKSFLSKTPIYLNFLICKQISALKISELL